MAIGIFNRVRGRMAQLGKVRPAAQQLGHKLAPVVCLYIRAKEIQVAPTKTKFTFNGIGRGEWISWKHIYSLQQHFPFFGCFQMEFFFPSACFLSLLPLFGNMTAGHWVSTHGNYSTQVFLATTPLTSFLLSFNAMWVGYSTLPL